MDLRAVLRETQCLRTNPPRIVLLVQFVAWKRRPFLVRIRLIIHPIPCEWFNGGPVANMKIGIFIPSVGIDEELPDVAVFQGRNLRGSPLQRQFIPTVHNEKTLILLGD